MVWFLSSLTYCQADKVRFTYKMEGLDKDWITTDPGQSHQNYTKLDAGTYTFIIHRTGFLEDEQRLQITIHPPIWLSTVAYIIYGLLGLAILIGIYRFQLKRQKERQAAQTLKEIDIFKNETYTNISHEIRSPLTLIMGIAEQLQNKSLVLGLINQILDLRKLEAGKFEVKFEQKEIVGLLKYTGQNVEPLIARKDINFQQTIEFEALVMDHDPDNLFSVISNLLDNAIKFTPKGGLIFYSVEQRDNQLLIEVTDTGQGISKEDLPKIFDRYVSTNAPNYTGTGIGLSLTKALVELMGGKITDTESDKPIVLIVEDNLEIAQMVGAMFDNKYQLAFATDGKEGLDKAIEFIPNLIISDVMMPLMDGFELCENLKANKLTSHIPIILLTAKVADESKIAGLKRGADKYLTKPINKAELLLSVHNALQNRTALKAHYYAKFTEQAIEKDEQTQFENRSRVGGFNPIKGIDFDIEDVFYQKVLSVLEQKSSDIDYTIEDLKNDLEVSPAQLYRKLQSLIGLTTGNTLKFFRFHKARILLKTTNLSITEVAFQSGFKDPSYFTRTFKSAYKITPSNFRKSGVGT